VGGAVRMLTGAEKVRALVKAQVALRRALVGERVRPGTWYAQAGAPSWVRYAAAAGWRVMAAEDKLRQWRRAGLVR